MDLAKELPANPTMRDINDLCVAKDIPSLAQGMIELPPPEKLRAIAAEVAMDTTVHMYRNRSGELEYRQAIATFVQREYGETVSEDQVLATLGVSGGIVGTLLMVRARKPATRLRVGLFEPFYTYHTFQLDRTLGDNKEIVPLRLVGDTFEPDMSSAEQLMTAAPLDLVIVCNPGNPGGNVWSPADMRRLVALTERTGATLLVDECYSDMVWGDTAHFSPLQDGAPSHVVVARGFSKVLGCQSWRVGYAVTSEDTARELMRIADPIYICCPWLQHALARYLKDYYDDFVRHKREVGLLMQENWRRLSKSIASATGWIPIEPKGTMYGMFRHASDTDMDAAKTALQHGVGVCPASMFFLGAPACTSYIRIHCGVARAKTDRIVALLSVHE